MSIASLKKESSAYQTEINDLSRQQMDLEGQINTQKPPSISARAGVGKALVDFKRSQIEKMAQVQALREAITELEAAKARTDDELRILEYQKVKAERKKSADQAVEEFKPIASKIEAANKLLVEAKESLRVYYLKFDKDYRETISKRPPGRTTGRPSAPVIQGMSLVFNRVQLIEPGPQKSAIRIYGETVPVPTETIEEVKSANYAA